MPFVGPGGGAAPEQYRCRAKRRCGLRCRGWAAKGRHYCRFHGGKNAAVRTDKMSFYGKRLGKTLQAAVDEMTSAPPSEQLSLYEELALARVTASEAVSLYDAAQKPGASDDAKAQACAVVRDALCFVRDMALAACKAEESARDKVSIHTVRLVVAQVVRCIYRALEDPQMARTLLCIGPRDPLPYDLDGSRLAAAIEAKIKEEVKLPTSEVVGMTDLTPDGMARAMDQATVKEDDDGDGAQDG